MRQIIKEGRLRRLGSVMVLDYSFTFSIIQPQVRLTLARKVYRKFRLVKLLKYISIRSLWGSHGLRVGSHVKYSRPRRPI